MTDRIREPSGRFGGYKPGTTSKAKRPRCKTTPPMTPPAEPTPPATPLATPMTQETPKAAPRNLRKGPLMKMPSVTSAPAAKLMRKTVQSIKDELIAASPTPIVALESLSESAIERAKGIRPPAISEPVAVSPTQQPQPETNLEVSVPEAHVDPKAIPETSQPKEQSQRATSELQEDLDEFLLPTQRIQAEEQPIIEDQDGSVNATGCPGDQAPVDIPEKHQQPNPSCCGHHLVQQLATVNGRNILLVKS